MRKEKDPAFLFYSQDFFTDTVLWDDAELGRYIRLLCLQHINGPFDPSEFDRLTQVNDLNIRSKFITNDLGQIYNVKLEEVREKRNEYITKQRENGRKGGRPKVKKETQTKTKNNPTVNPTLKPNHNPNESMRVENEDICLSTLREELDFNKVIKDIGQIENSTETTPSTKINKPVFFKTIKIKGNDRVDPKDDTHPFNVFWKEYPRRVKRYDAEKSLMRKVKDWETLKAIIVDLQKRITLGIWDIDEIQFIPHPTTYLNQELWNDELIESKPKQLGRRVVSSMPVPVYGKIEDEEPMTEEEIKDMHDEFRRLLDKGKGAKK